MTKKSIRNIIFFSLVICFVLLCVVQNTNKNIISLEVIFKNNEHQYIQLTELYDKINIDVLKKQSSYSIKDINTRLLEDSIETLSYVNNAEVYLSLNKLAIVIQQEIPFIRTMINGDTCFFTKDSIKLNLVDPELPKVLFFIDDIRSRPWKETLYLGNYVSNNSFLDSLISKVSHNQYSEYILHSDLFDFKINIGSVNKLDEKVDRIKLFFATIATEKRLIKELNVIYDNQIICVN